MPGESFHLWIQNPMAWRNFRLTLHQDVTHNAGKGFLDFAGEAMNSFERESKA